jgi:uncharacterized protein Smg (DUF494 family)
MKRNKYIKTFENFVFENDALNETIEERIDKLKEKGSKIKDRMKSKAEMGKVAAEKAKKYAERAGKASDPISKKIYQNRAQEEKMKAQISQQEMAIVQAKGKLLQSELNTAMMKKEKKDKAGA